MARSSSSVVLPYASIVNSVSLANPTPLSANVSACELIIPAREETAGPTSFDSSSAVRTSKTTKPPCGFPVKWSWNTGSPRSGDPMYSFSRSFASRADTPSGATA